jgi:hypothetical protein
VALPPARCSSPSLCGRGFFNALTREDGERRAGAVTGRRTERGGGSARHRGHGAVPGATERGAAALLPAGRLTTHRSHGGEVRRLLHEADRLQLGN